jgi:hypothetical protein
MKRWWALALTAIVPDVALADAPGMATYWLEASIPHEECMTRASRAMAAAGLTKNFDKTGQSVYGEDEDFVAAIRCVMPKSIVIFVTAGPKGARGQEIGKKLTDAFKAP